jgi:hypothetical protein
MAAGIRPFTPGDVPAVVALVRAHMEGWDLDERALVGLMLDHPWADDELPSLVAEEGGEIVGFVGVQARRMRMDGRSIRGVCCTHAVVAPDRRGGAAGALLLSRVLKGPQDVTWADSATDPVARVYGIFGGDVDHVRACDWMLVLRPVRWAREIVVGSVRREPVSRRTFAPVGALPAQAAGRRFLARAFPAADPGLAGEDASAEKIAEHVSAVNTRLRVWVDHDAEQLSHLFRLVETFRGPLVHRLVRRGDRPVGWYAYLLRRGGASRVLYLSALEHEVDGVLGELLAHARDQGSAVLTGRAEPHLHSALARRFAVLGYARQPTIRAKDPELAAALATSSSLLTRLDGEVFGI